MGCGLLACHTRDWLDPQHHIKLGVMVVHACNPNTATEEAEGSEAQGHPRLLSESQDSMGYRRPF